MINEEKEMLADIYTCNNRRPLYLLDEGRLAKNFCSLRDSFRSYYPKTEIAYSYKTNYTYEVCEIINRLGGYAEVVSGHEAKLALGYGVNPDKVIFNGVTDDADIKAALLEHGAMVNADSLDQLKDIINHLQKPEGMSIGLRIAVSAYNSQASRFGLCYNELSDALDMICDAKMSVAGIHCHGGHSRTLLSWRQRAVTMCGTAHEIEMTTGKKLRYIDLGGHLFGNMDERLKSQFDVHVPTFREYGDYVGNVLQRHFGDDGPMLILEPGTAIVADAISILAAVIDVKNRRGKKLVTLNVSSNDCGMIADCKDMPIENLSRDGPGCGRYVVHGYTCMEYDTINRECCGDFQKGDIVRILNCGAYSSSRKGPFICPPLPTKVVNGKEAHG